VLDQVLGLGAAAGHAQPVHPDEEAADPEALDQRHQVLVAPHRQQRLGEAGRLGGLKGLAGVGGQRQPVDPGAVAVVVGRVQGPPLARLDGAAGHLLVEPLHGPGEPGAVGVGVDRTQGQAGQRVVDRRHHRRVVVDQGAVPVPHQVADPARVPHAGQCRAPTGGDTGALGLLALSGKWLEASDHDHRDHHHPRHRHPDRRCDRLEHVRRQTEAVTSAPGEPAAGTAAPT
jgi:hypothetical protein